MLNGATVTTAPISDARVDTRIRSATVADAPGLRRLFAEMELKGPLRLAFERPDPWGVISLQCESPAVFTADAPDGGLLGCFGCGTREVYVNGDLRNQLYLSDLRIAPGARGGTWLARGFRHLIRGVLAPPAFAQTLVLQQNRRALKLLTAGRAGLPSYYPYGRYDYHVLPTRQTLPPADPHYRVATATPADGPAMQMLLNRMEPTRQFRPRLRLDRLGAAGDPYYRGLALQDFVLVRDRGGSLLALAGVWDQRHAKQTRILGYAPWLSLLRPLYNLTWGNCRGLALPPPGACLRDAAVTAFTVYDDDPGAARALIRGLLACAASRDRDVLYLGLAQDDPLQTAIRPWQHRVVHGRHFLVSAGPDPRPALDRRPFYFDSARI